VESGKRFAIDIRKEFGMQLGHRQHHSQLNDELSSGRPAKCVPNQDSLSLQFNKTFIVVVAKDTQFGNQTYVFFTV
jgi:hypothetical protein